MVYPRVAYKKKSSAPRLPAIPPKGELLDMEQEEPEQFYALCSETNQRTSQEEVDARARGDTRLRRMSHSFVVCHPLSAWGSRGPASLRFSRDYNLARIPAASRPTWAATSRSYEDIRDDLTLLRAQREQATGVRVSHLTFQVTVPEDTAIEVQDVPRPYTTWHQVVCTVAQDKAGEPDKRQLIVYDPWREDTPQTSLYPLMEKVALVFGCVDIVEIHGSQRGNDTNCPLYCVNYMWGVSSGQTTKPYQIRAKYKLLTRFNEPEHTNLFS